MSYTDVGKVAGMFPTFARGGANQKPSDALIQMVKKSAIKDRQPQTSSVMPLGLLYTLSKEQILDLLAYLESGGQLASHQHEH